MYFEHIKDLPVSIIIPYYRRPITLLQTLHTISLQTHELSLIEIIIVDDGSPASETPDISEFISTLEIKVLYQEDLGYRLSKARNLGISQAKHENIIILDCDLAVSRQFVERHLSVISAHEKSISVGFRDSQKVEDSQDPRIFKVQEPSKIGTFLRRDWRLTTHLDLDASYAESSASWTLCSGGNVAFKKSTFDDVGAYDERFTFWGGEDTEWAYRAYKRGYYFKFDPEVHAWHFDCRSFEYQENRYTDLSQKNKLLRSLVPAFENGYLDPIGEVPYVSIFITHYNKLEFLTEALMSIPKATGSRFEIVLVDDCSDCTLDEIKKQIPLDLEAKVRLFRFPSHRGVEECYAYAVRMCRGEYIAQLDADDYLLPSSIDLLIDTLKVSDKDLAYGKYKILDADGLRDGWVCKTATKEMRTLTGMYYHPLRVFRARALYRAGGMRILNLEAGVDFSLYSQLELHCEAIFCDVYTYVYRRVKNSITSEKYEKQVLAVKSVVNANAEHIYGAGNFILVQEGERLFRVTES